MFAHDFSLDVRPDGLSQLHANIVNWQTVNSGEQATVTATLTEYQPVAASGSYFPNDVCGKCGKEIPGNKSTVRIAPPVGPGIDYCTRCANYTLKKGFESHMSWMKKMLGFKADTPDGIVADWLEEKGLTDLAAALRAT